MKRSDKFVEMKSRLKGTELRTLIFQAALRLFRQKGWNGLTMRKIAGLIRYSAPVIYEHFENKAAINSELARFGFSALLRAIKIAKAQSDVPGKQLELIWLAYADFAQREKELYGLMFDAAFARLFQNPVRGKLEEMAATILAVIHQLPGRCAAETTYAAKVYYTLWSFTHGLSAIRLSRAGLPSALNRQFLADTINRLYVC